MKRWPSWMPPGPNPDHPCSAARNGQACAMIADLMTKIINWLLALVPNYGLWLLASVTFMVWSRCTAALALDLPVTFRRRAKWQALSLASSLALPSCWAWAGGWWPTCGQTVRQPDCFPFHLSLNIPRGSGGGKPPGWPQARPQPCAASSALPKRHS